MPELKRVTTSLRAIGEVIYYIDVYAEQKGYMAAWHCTACDSGSAAQGATSAADAVDLCVEDAQRHHAGTHIAPPSIDAMH